MMALSVEPIDKKALGYEMCTQQRCLPRRRADAAAQRGYSVRPPNFILYIYL